MRFFVPTQKDGATLGVWHFDGKVAVKIGVTAPMDIINAHAVALPGETLLAAMERQMPAWASVKGDPPLREMKLAPGEFYPRMARPNDQHPKDSPGNCPLTRDFEHELASMRGQLVSLMRSLERVCQTVHPCNETFGAYGHEIRNLLILACTEVETHWKAVLAANGVIKDRYSTNDYVSLQSAMRLGEYSIKLNYYPWLPAFRPFEKWGTSGRPTQELGWYSAYNKVKHDREQHFAQATLLNAINAVSACVTMLCAQFGKGEAFRWRSEFGFFFGLQDTPVWDPAECYTYPYDGFSSGYRAVPYAF